MARWWRAYDEAVDDPKLQLLPDRLFRAWFNLMCLASANDGNLPKISTISFKLRTSEDKAKYMIAELAARGLIDGSSDGNLQPHNWNHRQFKSDVTDPTAAERMRRYRNRHRNETVTETVTVTVPRDREQNTEQKASPFVVPRRARKPKVPFPENWFPQAFDPQRDRNEFAKMRDWAMAKDARFTDWEAFARNWKRNNSKFSRGGNGTVPRPGSREDRQEKTANAIAQLDQYIARKANERRAGGDFDQADDGVLPLAKPS